MKLIVDGHLDLAWNAMSFGRDITLPLDEINRQEASLADNPGRGRATTSLPEMRRGGVMLCLATLMARVRPHAMSPPGPLRINLDYSSAAMAFGAAQGQLAYYRLLDEQRHIRLIGDGETLDKHWRQCSTAPLDEVPVGVILAMEGAGPIVEPAQVGAWHVAGLRCLNVVHYGRNRYAVGTGDSGPLTSDGRRLLREMERVNMILDTTHLSDPSFFDAVDCFGGPVLASHQNCRALVPGDRQYSDEQIRLLIERGGVIGVMMDALMLSPTWRKGYSERSEVGLQAVIDHVDHICQLAGNCRHVALGSDLDGGFGREQCPEGLDTIADLQKIDGLLRSRGYGDDDVDALFHNNLLRFLNANLAGTGAELNEEPGVNFAAGPAAKPLSDGAEVVQDN